VGGSRRVDLADSLENEWLCAQILYYLHLPVATTEMWRFEDQKALVVTRFDRSRQVAERDQEWIARLPQEDFCQALGVPPSQKYEKDGGPGIADCMRLLAGSSDNGDRQSFALTQLAFWLMGAPDGHAKNYSIFLERGDAYISTPLYDVLSIFPYVGDGANQIRWRKAGPAMALRSKNAHWHFVDIEPRTGHEARRPPRVGGDGSPERTGRPGPGSDRPNAPAGLSPSHLGCDLAGNALPGRSFPRGPRGPALGYAARNRNSTFTASYGNSTLPVAVRFSRPAANSAAMSP
jgi:HipA-like C-terminal domain